MRLLATITTLLLIIGLLLGGCAGEKPIPTKTSLDMAITAEFMTENAPPPGFDHGVAFAPIDRNLEALPHWHYVVSLSFEGNYADTQKATTGTISAEVYSNELVGERRVIIRAAGDAFGPSGARNVEGVRLGNEYYFVDQNGVCSKATDDPNRRRVADLTAGSLIGGIKHATHTYAHKTVDSVPTWQYAFMPGDVDPPSLEMTQGGKVTIASGELWVAPSLNAVLEYGITLQVQSVILPIFQGDRQLTGKLQASYRLLETNVSYNIAIPFGC